jgi:hypothetical protein
MSIIQFESSKKILHALLITQISKQYHTDVSYFSMDFVSIVNSELPLFSFLCKMREDEGIP